MTGLGLSTGLGHELKTLACKNLKFHSQQFPLKLLLKCESDLYFDQIMPTITFIEHYCGHNNQCVNLMDTVSIQMR